MSDLREKSLAMQIIGWRGMFEETASAVKTSHRKVQQNQALTLTGHLLWAAAVSFPLSCSVETL